MRFPRHLISGHIKTLFIKSDVFLGRARASSCQGIAKVLHKSRVALAAFRKLRGTDACNLITQTHAYHQHYYQHALLLLPGEFLQIPLPVGEMTHRA
jgi:hypothetical protein